MFATRDEQRFSRNCDNCGEALFEHSQNQGSNKYPNWQYVEEDHTLEACLRYLKRRIERLER